VLLYLQKDTQLGETEMGVSSEAFIIRVKLYHTCSCGVYIVFGIAPPESTYDMFTQWLK
jgi:hypothetical protein